MLFDSGKFKEYHCYAKQKTHVNNKDMPKIQKQKNHCPSLASVKYHQVNLLSYAQYLSAPRFTPVSYALATRIMEGRSPASAALSK